jgi:dephospho-CoA kinase
VGLTGGIASGKSTAADHLAHLGALIIDTDQIAHSLTSVISGRHGAALAPIADAFGKDFLNADGSLNRGLMRAHVFASPAERLRLESILHPLIGQETRAQAQQTEGNYVVFVVPLLVESPHWRARVDRIAVVDCDPSVQLARVLQRPGMTLTQAQQIIAVQSTRETRLAAADDVISNAGNRAELLAQVEALHQQYCHYASA